VSIIEQAAKRLEELRRSGVELPPEKAPRRAPADPPQALTPERAVRAIEQASQGGLPREGPVGLSGAKADMGQPRAPRVHIDLHRLAAAGYLTPDASRSQIADEFRVIKRPLLANVRGQSAAKVDRANLIMVTSSLPGEGKTFVAVNLAMSLAMELDNTVLLVDADVSRPSVLERLGLSPAPGLLDVLTDTACTVGDVLLRTDVEKLSVLPAGKASARATELLASEAMSRLVQELATRYADRIVVFDAPPLLPSTESRALATHMGQVIVVVEAERTPQASVLQAMATVESCPVVMTVLNKVPRSSMGSYYGHYGEYGY